MLLGMGDDEEHLADLQREVAELIVALTWVEPQDTKAGERVSNLDKWSEDEAYPLLSYWVTSVSIGRVDTESSMPPAPATP